jgi:hypothetical protein
MTGAATLLIAVGLFLGAGAYSFWKQELPKGVVVLLALSSALCLVAGVLRLEVWQ